jgi:response regulator RpfG family c-di-GMP phosphodiesterase
VGRLVRQLAEKMGLEPSTTAMMIAAAFVHDLGKMGSYHLTAYNCSEYDGHKVASQKAYGFPARLLEPVRLPIDTMLAATHMYERYDGKGFPTASRARTSPWARACSPSATPTPTSRATRVTRSAAR